VRVALLFLIGIITLIALPVAAQQKPRVFVTPYAARRTEGLKGPSYNERETTVEDRTVEISREFSQSCATVTVTGDRRDADYILKLGRSVGRNQLAVYRKNGDLVGVAQKPTVGGAAKGACELIKKDLPPAVKTPEEKLGQSAGK
jgi:hypothetical protein